MNLAELPEGQQRALRTTKGADIGGLDVEVTQGPTMGCHLRVNARTAKALADAGLVTLTIKLTDEGRALMRQEVPYFNPHWFTEHYWAGTRDV